MADRVVPTEKENNTYRLDIKHCLESDSGIYVAKATNGNETSTSSAQLIVQECKNIVIFFICLLSNICFIIFKVTAEQKANLSDSNAPYFTIKLKDTEIIQNTFLRFMVKVRGDPNPIVKL